MSKTTNTIEATGHNFINYEQTKAPTCTENGEEIAKCENCEEKEIREIEKLGHNFDTQYTIDKEPTCTEKGSKSQHCLRCEEKQNIKEIEKLEHTAGEPVQENKIEATCTKNGSYNTVVYCTVCNAELSKTTNTIEATGHNFINYEQTKAPACTENGEEIAKCENCEEKEIREIEKLGHDFETEYTVDKVATCTEKGNKSQHCLRCEEKQNIKEIEKLEHIAGEPVQENKVEATCTKNGSYDTVIYCTVCNVELSKIPNVIEATGHNFINYQQTKEPTSTENGEEIAKCENCEEIDKRIIAKIDDNKPNNNMQGNNTQGNINGNNTQGNTNGNNTQENTSDNNKIDSLNPTTGDNILILFITLILAVLVLIKILNVKKQLKRSIKH